MAFTSASIIPDYGFHRIISPVAAQTQSANDWEVQEAVSAEQFVGVEVVFLSTPVTIFLELVCLASRLFPASVSRRLATAHVFSDYCVRLAITSTLRPTKRTVLSPVDFVIADNASVCLSAACIHNAVTRRTI